MEPQEQDILHRYYERLSENLEPKDLIERLGILGAIRSEDIEAVLKEWIFEGEDRSKQAQWLLESLRNHDQGMKYLIQGLLSSESQDFLAREILEDEFFVENDQRIYENSFRNF
ncbi:hypothetical protein AC249_AIPGENE7454 [Exaiptasia diaphana]|nr:hypothetical protein AC249_AIPGENE7454 [Exaiptasia diaphana]